MPEEPLAIPLVYVELSDDETEPAYTQIRYFVEGECIVDMSIEKEYVPFRPDFFPAMILTQLLVTPHQHLALLGEFATICAAINPEHVPVPADTWKQLLERTQQLLNPPPPPEDVPVVQG